MFQIDPPLAFFIVGSALIGWGVAIALAIINGRLEDTLANVKGHLKYHRARSAELAQRLSERPSAAVLPFPKPFKVVEHKGRIS
jgi:hypothetical protein